MSYDLFPLEHEQALQNLPEIARFQNSLLLIETAKNIANPSFHHFDEIISNQQCSEVSIGIQIKKKEKQIASHSFLSEKKKKTGCTCKKTKCLKMYCECFSQGKLCEEGCDCYSCCNTEQHKLQIEKAKEQIKSKSSRKNTQGCNCKKSQCQKKYCECFNAGLKCSQACKCCDCQNMEHKNHEQEDMDMNREQHSDDKEIEERSSQRRREVIETPCKTKRGRANKKCELTNYKQRREDEIKDAQSIQILSSFKSWRMINEENK